MTIKQATLTEFTNYPKSIIPIAHIISFVRTDVFPRAPFDGTILRKLRELRQEGKIDYEVIDRKRSLYKRRDG